MDKKHYRCLHGKIMEATGHPPPADDYRHLTMGQAVRRLNSQHDEIARLKAQLAEARKPAGPDR